MSVDFKDIFLSYSEKDITAVEKLAFELKNAGASVWFDKWDIQIGDPITKSIEQGLSNSKFVGIWITKNALDSGWVEKEWSSRIADEIKTRHVILLPLLAEECTLPLFLRDKLCANFTSNYQEAFRRLLETLQIAPLSKEKMIFAFTKDILEDLENEVIHFPLNGSIKIIDTLKRLPRSGKYIRLKAYEPKVKIRSIYDHILSVAHSADCLFSYVNHGIRQEEASEVARCIAFHELNEIILGDIPSYTNITYKNIKNTNLYAWKNLKEIDKPRREEIANEFISLFLGERERKSLQKVMEYFKDREHPISSFVFLLDKLDPIINVWRYLYTYKGKLDENANIFLHRLKDFFDYPDVKELARNYKRDPKIYDLVLILQDRELAKKYYNDNNAISVSLSSKSIPIEIFHELIEGKEIIYTYTQNYSAKKLKKS